MLSGLSLLSVLNAKSLSEQALNISQSVGVFIARVGVFENQPLAWVKEVSHSLRLSAIQLHGQEDAIYAKALGKDFRIIKAVSFQEGLDPKSWLDFPADALHLDGLKPGSGETFDWSVASAWKGHPKLILAGGLTPENVAKGIAALKPYAVDTASGVEAISGIKDAQKIQHFVRTSKNS